MLALQVNNNNRNRDDCIERKPEDCKSHNNDICKEQEIDKAKQKFKTQRFDACGEPIKEEKIGKLNLKINDYDICNDGRDLKAEQKEPELKILDNDFCNDEHNNWGECFVIIIFPTERGLAYRNAAVKEKAILSRYSIYNPAKHVGFSYQIHFIDGAWNPKESIGVIKFNTYRDAKMWLESDNAYRAQDFLNHVDIWIAPINREDMSHKGYPVMQIVCQKVCYPDIFFDKYLPAEEKAVLAQGGIPFVVNYPRPYCWRGKKPPGHIIINQFPSCEAYKTYRCLEANRVVVNSRKEAGEGFSIATKLNIDI